MIITPNDIRPFIDTPGQIIAQIAHSIGYESEVGFKREIGELPARPRGYTEIYNKTFVFQIDIRLN